ncbi:hypothetical protein [Paraburkholderia sp. RL17-337-BIB-A]|uniref:hypothetical protein n=1 Tax=Paraburkholderia sp. RL17-337-BIB-A TaxID=3031636 RepID=UPI0038BCA6F2
MKLFRAIPANPGQTNASLVVEGQLTRRIPRNVPYVVDNVWEYLRPTAAPSRRHAAYASPTPELALKNASSRFGAAYEVWEVDLGMEDTVVVCSVSDAREHKDIERVPAALLQSIGRFLGTEGFDVNKKFAPLYLPGLNEEDLRRFFAGYPDLLAQALAASTFWQDARILTFTELARAPEIAESAEIFFNARNGYRMRRTLS